jgi:hypothetical protein
MVGRACREIAGAVSILEDQKPVTSQPSHYGTGRRRSHRPLRHSCLRAERFGERSSELLLKLLPGEHLARCIGGLIITIRSDHHFASLERCGSQRYRQDKGIGIRNAHRPEKRLIAEVGDLQRIAPGRDVEEMKVPVVVRYFTAIDLDQQERGEADRLACLRVDHTAGEGAGGREGWSPSAGDRTGRTEKNTEQQRPHSASPPRLCGYPHGVTSTGIGTD